MEKLKVLVGIFGNINKSSYLIKNNMKNLLKKLFKRKKKNHFYSTDVWSEIADKYLIKNRLWHYVKMQSPKDIGSGVVLYGEIYGGGIQKGYDYGLEEIQFVVFDIMENGKYMDTQNTLTVTTNLLGLRHVEILYTGLWNKEIQDKYVFNNFIEGIKKPVPHEGIVVKHTNGERSKISKIINPDYLIFSEKHNVEDSH